MVEVMLAIPLVRHRSAESAGPIRIWLWAVAGLIFMMVVVGGATRLTESGLSIVEWRPVTGALLPLSTADWQSEFEKYQATPQYQRVNRGMSLDDFKTIYAWEWTHRLLGRLIGAAFLLPFLFFLGRGAVSVALRGRLWTIFTLGAAQGAIGWWMVASGLVDRVEVSQYRLAIHMVFACAIFAFTLWTAQWLTPQPPIEVPPRLKASAIALVLLVLAQIYFGALLAGLRGGLVYNTWPLIGDQFFPSLSELFPSAPAWRNLFENPVTVQFIHRMTAYLLWLGGAFHLVDVLRTHSRGRVVAGAAMLAGGITIQACLGILTLLHQAPIGLALAHQAMAVVVLAVAVLHAERLRAQPATAPAAASTALASSP